MAFDVKHAVFMKSSPYLVLCDKSNPLRPNAMPVDMFKIRKNLASRELQVYYNIRRDA